ncbi:methyltransferase domain-containing protein, partial [bacterium]|nr:methyltransferase domain-containing protein [bacterium]
QENLILNSLGDLPGLRVLDLGSGTGRTSLPLSHRGAYVVAADASMKMLAITQEKAFLQGTPVHLSRIDAHDLPFADQSFDASLSFRMIMHVTDWQRTVKELCRVTRDTVIIDFPPKCGFAGFVPIVHPLIQTFNPNHQAYRIFKIKDVIEKLNHQGFQVKTIDRHLVLPFGLHRMLNSIKFTRMSEHFLARIKLQALFGAPVTLVAIRDLISQKDAA